MWYIIWFVRPWSHRFASPTTPFTFELIFRKQKIDVLFLEKNGILKMLCLYCSSCYHFENQFHISFQNLKKKPSAAKTQQERIQFFGKTIDKHIWRLILYVISANWIEFRFVLFSVVNQNKLIYKSSSVLFVNSCSVFAM